jgi:hypothetical protein
MSGGPSTATKSAVPTPMPRKNRFSTSRSWAVARAAAPGATRTPAAVSRSTAAAGTFSNSKVTTGARRANASSAAGSV